MKKIGLLFIVFLLMVGLLSNGSFAQNYTQWHLPEGAKIRLGKGQVNDVKFSRDGGILAVATDIGVWLYDAHTGSEIALLSDTPKNVRTITFSLVSASADCTLRLWNTETQDQQLIRVKHPWSAFDFAFSQDGNTVAIGNTGGRTRLWSTVTEDFITILKARDRALIDHVTFSPNDKILASGSFGGSIQLWDVLNHQSIATLNEHTSEISALAFSPDGKILVSAARYEPMIVLWDINNIGSKTVLLVEGNFGAEALTFSPDGKTLISGHRNGRIYASDVATGEQLRFSQDLPVASQHWRSLQTEKYS